jgi:general secretion pathway protein G
MHDHKSRQAGFTLVEILIVVTILGILAAIVVPQMGTAADMAKDNSLQMTIRRVRNQISVYKAEHNGNPPALANFESQLTTLSKIDGSTAARGTDGFPFGPYIDKMPTNPNTGTSTISAGAVGSSAWYYDESTGAFHANDTADTRAY